MVKLDLVPSITIRKDSISLPDTEIGLGGAAPVPLTAGTFDGKLLGGPIPPGACILCPCVGGD